MQRNENCLPPILNLVDAAREAQSLDDPEAVLDHVYTVFLRELKATAESLPQLMYGQPPYQQLQTMMKILDRLETLKVLMSDTPMEQVIRVEYVDPDGSIHDTPIWQREEDADERMN